jgi:hypothetical protein
MPDPIADFGVNAQVGDGQLARRVLPQIHDETTKLLGLQSENFLELVEREHRYLQPGAAPEN